ncbi:MAG: Crp/Fnr family transcriptional regulator [Flavobacteriales bacterium]|nr:Crp/Fnr family transcriptional regulator [Flavobacteriales bacterium]
MTLKEYLSTYIQLNSEEELPFKHTEKIVQKNTILTKYDDVEDKVYFLNSGVVQILYLEDGEEKIFDFVVENSFFNCYTSFLTGSSSDFQLVTLSECVIEEIEADDLRDSYETSLVANKIGRVETEKLYLQRVRQTKQLRSLSAEERYQWLLENRPEIIAQTSVQDVSKYLGIRPESLSRIRKNIIF